MGPGADEQPDGHAPAGERAVLLQGLLDEQVLPAAHQQHRDRDPLQRGTALHGGPERVAGLRVVHPSLGPGRLAADHVGVSGRDREALQHLAQPPFGRGHAHHRAQHPDALLVRDQVAPHDVVVQIEGAVAVRGPVEVVRADVHHGGDQFRRRVHGQRPLHEAEVAGAVGGQPALEPALLAQPRHGVLPVGDLVPHRLEVPAGPERAAHALQQHVIAALGEDLPGLQGEQAGAAVRAADQHGGRGRHADRDVVGGQQHRAVGHRHLDVVFDRDLVPPRRQRPPPGRRPADRGRAPAQRTGAQRPGSAGLGSAVLARQAPRACHALLAHHAVLPPFSATTIPAGTGSA